MTATYPADLCPWLGVKLNPDLGGADVAPDVPPPPNPSVNVSYIIAHPNDSSPYPAGEPVPVSATVLPRGVPYQVTVELTTLADPETVLQTLVLTPDVVNSDILGSLTAVEPGTSYYASFIVAYNQPVVVSFETAEAA